MLITDTTLDLSKRPQSDTKLFYESVYFSVSDYDFIKDKRSVMIIFQSSVPSMFFGTRCL